MRLLVVEDSPLLRKMFGLAFPHQFNELGQAENGRQAIQMLERADRPFDAVLLDLRMPDMNGIDFIRALHRLPAHQSTPVVLTTAEADESELLREATQLGVAAVVKKPWTPHKLRLLVEQIVNPPTG
ncbi:MAG TPA: response regulator [Gemmatimonadales bacterium]|nr:response regulator [Gemmatimonadales bacterium]